MAQETHTGALYQPRGVGIREMGGRFKQEGIYVYQKAMAPHSNTLAGKSHGQRSLVGCSPWGR